MVKVIRTPALARKYFSANALAGWPNGVRYTVRDLRRKRRLPTIEPKTTYTLAVVRIQVDQTY